MHQPIEAANKILVRAPNWVGDVVMFLPALQRLARRFPDAEIHVLARSATADLLGRMDGVRRVVPADLHGPRSGAMDFLHLAGLLRAEGYDLAVLFRNAFRAALLVRLAGIPRRLGYGTDARAWLLTHPVPAPQASNPAVHDSVIHMDMLVRAGLIESSPGVAPVRIEPDARLLREVRKWLIAYGVLGRPLRVAIAPGAANGTARCWLLRRYAELADRLIEERGAGVVLCGSPAERELGSRIDGQMHRRAYSFFDGLSLMEMHALFSCMDVVVSNDSGAAHLASTVGVPQVVVFGPTDEHKTGPLNPRAHLVRQPADCSPCHLHRCPIDHRCMQRVETAHVWDAIESIRREASA